MPPTRPGLHEDASGWIYRVPKVAPPSHVFGHGGGRSHRWDLSLGSALGAAPGRSPGRTWKSQRGQERQFERRSQDHGTPCPAGPLKHKQMHVSAPHALLCSDISRRALLFYILLRPPDCSPHQLSPEEEQPGAGSSSPARRALCARRSSRGNPLHKASEAIAPEGLCEGTG